VWIKKFKEEKTVKKFRKITNLCIALVLVLAMTLLTACGGSSTQPSGVGGSTPASGTTNGEFDWRRYAGTKISITGVEGVYNEQILEAIEPFEKLTGIKVEKVDFVPEADYTNKIQLLSSSKSSEYDVYMVSFTNLFDFVPNGWIEPLDSYINNPMLADPNLNMDDYYDTVLNFCFWDGVSGTPLGRNTSESKQYAMPFGWIVFNLLYRTDIFEKYNLEVPKTVDDIIEAGKIIQANEPDMYGVAMRGFKSVDMLYGGIWQTMLSKGGTDFDTNMNPVFDSDENVKGLEKVAEMLNTVGPKEWANMTWYEVLTDLQAGKCAMAIDAPSLATWIATGEDSVAKGKIDVAPPVYIDDPAKAKSIIFGWNLGMNAYSANKEAAWYFIQYCSGAERQSTGTRLAFPSRKSAMEDPEYVKSLEESGLKNFIPAWNATAAVADVLFTPATGFNDYGYVLAGELQNAVLGNKTAKEALSAVSKYYNSNYK